MGIVDDYLNSDSAKTVAPEVKSSSLVDQYLNAPEAKPLASKTVAPVRPPISGVSKEASEEINAQPAKAGGANPRDSALSEGIAAAPGNVGRAIGEDFKAGLDTIGSGAQDILNNKPASGIGKVGLGALSAAVSPISGGAKELIEKPATELTGNPQFGKVVSDVATSGLPIARAAKATVAALPKNRALSTLVESIGPENVGAVAKAMRENPRLSPVDLSPKVKQDTQSLFVTDGPHINYIDQRVKERAAGAQGAVEGAMDAHLGGTVDAVQKLKELKQNIKDVGSKKIQPALENTGPVDVSDAVKNIDKILKPGVNSVFSNETQLASTEVNKQLEFVRQYLTDGQSSRTDPQQLHAIQSALRSKADQMLNSSSGQDRQIGQALMKVRGDIVTAIDAGSPRAKATPDEILKQSGVDGSNLSPALKDKTVETLEKANGGPILSKERGTYKEALGNYRDEFHIQDAFEHGHDAIITNSKAITNRPEFFKQWVKNASPEELNAAKEGARVAIDTQINGFKHAARRGTDVGEVDFNRQRIEALFGKTEADKLFTKLTHEREIADTNNKLTQGSQTAMRMASKAAFALPTKGDVGKNMLSAAVVEGASTLASGMPGIGTAAYTGMKVATAAKDAIAMKIAREHNARYAQYALPTEGPSREELIKSLEAIANKPAKQSLARRAVNKGVRLGSLIAP